MGASLISTYQAFISWRPGTLYDAWPGDGVKLSLVKMVQCNFIYFHQKGALLQWSKTIWSAVAAFTFQTCDKCWKGLELERTSLKLGLEMMAFPQSIRQWQAIDFNSLHRYLWMQVARQILYVFFWSWLKHPWKPTWNLKTSPVGKRKLFANLPFFSVSVGVRSVWRTCGQQFVFLNLTNLTCL